MNGFENVRIESDGTPQGTHVYGPDGKPVSGIQAVNFAFDIRLAKPIPLAQLVLGTCQLSLGLQCPSLAMIHPVEGDVRAIQRVTFVDGSTWEASPAAPQTAIDRSLVENLLDALCGALPYVEDCEDSAHFKPGVVKKQVKKIRAVIGRAERVLS